MGMCLSALVGYVDYIGIKRDSFQYLGLLKLNVKQSADKLNILDTFVSIMSTISTF